MRIERVELTAFGGFSDTVVDFSSRPQALQIVYGPNESGKSTSLRAIASWLFGIPTRTIDSYRHSYQNMRVGGVVSTDSLGPLHCVRRKGRGATLLSGENHDAIPESQLRQYLSDLDEETFLHGYGLDRTRLIEGGKDIIAGEGDLGEILFSAGMGVSHLKEIRQQLHEQREEIYTPQAKKRQLNKLLAEIKQLRSDVANRVLSTVEYDRRTTQLREAREEADQARTRRNALTVQKQRVENALTAIPLVIRKSQFESEYHPLQQIPNIDADFTRRRRDASEAIARSKGSAVSTSKRLDSHQRKLNELGQPGDLLAYHETIESLVRQSLVVSQDRQRMISLTDKVSLAEDAITNLLETSGLQHDHPLLQRQLPHDEIQQLRDLEDLGIRLDEQVRASKAALRTEEEAQAAHAEEIVTTDESIDPSHLTDVLNSIESPKHLTQELLAAQHRVTACQETCTRLLKELPGLQATLSSVTECQPPDEATADLLGAKVLASKQASEAKRTEVGVLETQTDRLAAELVALRHGGLAPTLQELQQIRETRDQLIDEVLTAPSDESRREVAEQLRHHILQADEVADRISSAAEQVAKRIQLEQEMELKNHDLKSEKKELRKLERTAKDALEAWTNLWERSGITPVSVEGMAGWHRKYTAVLDAISIQNEASRELAEHTNSVHQIISDIRDALRPHGIEIDEAVESLAVSVNTAKRVHDECHARRRQLQSARERSDQLERDVKKAKAIHRESLTQLKNWSEERTKKLTSLGLDPNLSARQVASRLDAREKFLQKRDEIGQHQKEIKQIKTRAAQFVRGVAELRVSIDRAERLAKPRTSMPAKSSEPIAATDDLDEQGAHRWVAHWKSALRQAEQVANQRESLTSQINDCQRELVEIEQQQRDANTILAQLCKEAQCASPDELAELEQKSQRKGWLREQLQDIDAQLTKLGQGEDLDVYTDSVRGLDESTLLAELQDCSRELESMESRIAELEQQFGAAEQAVKEMDGNGTAAEVNQQLESAKASADRLAHQYSVLSIQIAALDAAMERYREQNQGPVLSKAESMFRKLTCGRYEQLKPLMEENGPGILVGVQRGSDQTVPANLMSEGTADALFLSLRLASTLTSIEAKAPVPIILDDVLVQFDDERCMAALQLLVEVSQSTQVILFTHHQHVVQLAETCLGEGECDVHSLAATNAP